ncbi:multidrug ABC transporter ATP-binding protein [Roseobacter cerasinus]|uniref:Multidrug ABC transporter ATP-binding protein n=1 Tax=Roseobacter cerasinus TaxID=2602289 RepID=A0A640VTD3_9RHOB|nr:ABC transporter ATP-binding protein [Roseobacter cerasinus]GFE51077.1 multidrug ABC transporter ATP-binding protein [Roseobacter cerasinus]
MFRFFESRIDPFAAPPEDTPPATVIGFIRSQLAPYRRWLPWVALTGLLAALIETALIFYSGRLIDLMAASGPNAFWADHWGETLLVLGFVLLVRPAVVGLNHLLLEQTLSSNLQEQIRWRAHRHLLRQSVGFFQTEFAGRLSARVMQMGPAVQDNVHMSFEALWYSLTYVLGAAVILSQIDIRLAVPLMLWVVGYVAFVRFVAARVGVASERWAQARSRTAGRIVDAYSNIETVKLFSGAAQEETYALTALRRLRLRFQKFLRMMTALAFGLNAINGVLIVIVVGPAVWLWTHGNVSLGEVAAAAALTIRLNGMSSWILWVTVRLFENGGMIREGLQSIAAPVEIADAPGAVALPRRGAEIRIENLSHHYGKDMGGLTDITLTIPEGQRVGLVGPSGAGKSTLVKLLMRFHEIEQGRILINGHPINTVTQNSLRQRIGMVSQDTSLLHRSVRENILYGRAETTEAEMIRAAKQARAHEFIMQLQDHEGRRGYDTQVGERGVTLSGGQRQRIAIARVILKNAPILILDEATSALDSAVEAEVQEALQNVMTGKTVIAIAHRLSTIARMDRIIVLDKGRIVGDGTHEALLRAGGLYSDLWLRQSGATLEAQ